MLTTSQQQVAIVVLIVALAVFVLLSLAGGVVIYLLYTRGYAPIALFLLLPVLLVTAIFFPLIWLVGAAIQDFDQRHEKATLVTSREPAPESVPASSTDRQRAAAAGEHAPEVGRRKTAPRETDRYPGGTPVPTA
jgi:hypothetical protein